MCCVCRSLRSWLTRCIFFFFQAEDGIRDLVRSRGLGDVYKRQLKASDIRLYIPAISNRTTGMSMGEHTEITAREWSCLLYTSDAADERSSVDLGGRRIIKKKKSSRIHRHGT